MSRSTVVGSRPSKAPGDPCIFAGRADAARAPAARDTRFRSGCGTFGTLFGLGGDGSQRPRELAQQGLVARVRGGVRALQRGQSEVGFDLRLRLEVERKRAIARAAAALVDEGEAVALDASTTAYYLALELRRKRELVVVTNGLLVATALADAPGITVLVTGGMLRLSAMSLVGDLGTDVLRTTRINKGFLGARGLSLERGLMDLNPDEVRIKQEMADACEQVLRDPRRRRSGTAARCSRSSRSNDSHGIVTDSSAPDDEVEAWRAAGVDVITADPGPREPPPVRPRDLRRAVRNDAAGRLMATMAAVDLGAQSGRVAVGALRRRAPDGRRGAPVRERARRRSTAALHWDVAAPVRGGARRAPHGRTRGRRSTRSPSTRGPSTSACSTRQGSLSHRPVHYRDTRRADAVDGVLRARPAARALRAHRHPAACRSTRSSSSPRWRWRPIRRSTRAERLLLIPDLLHYWLCGASVSEFTNATTTQCFDPRTSAWADDLLERLDIPTRLLPEVVTRDPLGPLRRRAENGLGAEVVAVATHDTGSAVAAVPFREAGSAFLSVGTWSLVGLEVDEPLITDETFAANLTNEGGVAGTFRLLRNVTGLWLLHECRRELGVEGTSSRSRSSSRSRTPLRSLCSLIDPDDEAFVGPGDMPARIARVLRLQRPAGARGAGSHRPLHPREHRAQARRGRSTRLRDDHRDCADRAPRRRRRRTERAALPMDGRGGRPAGACRAGGGDARREPARPGDGARASSLARGGARGRARFLRPGGVRTIVRAGLGRGPRPLRGAARHPGRARGGLVTEATAVLHGIPAPEDRWDDAGRRRSRRPRRARPTAPTSSAPTERSRTSAAATPRRRRPPPTTPAARCGCCG